MEIMITGVIILMALAVFSHFYDCESRDSDESKLAKFIERAFVFTAIAGVSSFTVGLLLVLFGA